MNLGEMPIVLRHRKPLELVDLTLLFVRTLAPKKYLALSGLVLSPALVLCVALREFGFEWWQVWIIALALARFLELPFSVLSSHTLLRAQDTRLREVLRESLSVLLSYSLGLLLYLIIWTLSLVLILGPLFVGSAYFFLPEILVLEKCSARKAFARSSRFLDGRGGTGVEGLMMKTALLSCFVLIFETLGQATLEFGLAVQMEHDTLWENGGSYFALLGLFAFVPYGATLRFLAYINERTRHDGWDVQVAFLRLGTQTAITPETSASQRRADTDAA